MAPTLGATITSSNGACNTKTLTIKLGENLENHLFRVDKNTQLVLRPDPSSLASNVCLKTNYPPRKSDKFLRSQYRQLELASDHQDMVSSAFNWHTSLILEQAGTFHFVCTRIQPDDLDDQSNGSWSAYVVVNPELKIPLNSIKCQTVVSKNLGPFCEWRKRLTLAKDCRYNMIHFTPVQELGASNSAYALRNQHKVNPDFGGATLDDIKREVEFMEKKWNVLSVTDLVLNHTADDSEWIREHPESAYNLNNSPHLRPAFLLDSAFIWMMQDILSGSLMKTDDISASINNEHDVQTIGVMLRSFYVAQLKIWELFMVNIGSAVTQFGSLARADSLEIDYGHYDRNGAQVKAIPRNLRSAADLRQLLEAENLRKRNQVKASLDQAIQNVLNSIRYERLDPQGPYHGRPISPDAPLVAPYFSHTPLADFRPAREEWLMFHQGNQFMAHNGWLFGSSSVVDFAAPESEAYLRRELIAWGDCIKLRFGSEPSEAPYLWEHMRRYVEAQAKVFHGFRLDNCHSTPVHVAEFVVDAARAVRPDVYIMAELFTSSEATDNLFVNRLGITSLIREAMSAHSPRELGRLVYRFGGTPVGAFLPLSGADEPLRPSVAHAIFYDQTHDNEPLLNKHSGHDLAPTSALINMASCATGSTRGYDELVPHQVNVVSELRPYALEIDHEQCGLCPLRRLLNGQLQRELSQGFSEIFVDQVNEQVIAITRHNPTDGRSIVLVARTAFSPRAASDSCPMRPICTEGHISRIVFESQAHGSINKWERNPHFINGLPSFKTVILSHNASPQDSKLARLVHPSPDRCEIHLDEFQFLPSSVLALEICLNERQSDALRQLNQWAPLPTNELSLSDANYILFRTNQEDPHEQPYSLPDFCSFTYNGLYGLMYHLNQVHRNQDQAHPLAMNLRQGNWLSSYLIGRLTRRPSTKALGEHLGRALDLVELLPRGMVPKYFHLVVGRLYQALVEEMISRMSVFVSKGPQLVRLLALSSLALVGECKSAPMPAILDSKLGYSPSLAAGLPHFASGYLRNWGRDTFIALRGLLLVTGRFGEARSIILAYATTLKHGLIPNLLDGGHKSRYNCRDAVWWWLYSIKEYTKMAPNGFEILRAKVRRLHTPEQVTASTKINGTTGPGATQNHLSNGCSETTPHIQTLAGVIQEALECHFRSMEFTEEGAGPELDEHMSAEGFKVGFGVDRETGFVFGGNQWNCGTWMDKMGSSKKAGTKGKPSSPRDGAAVEIVGLCKAVVTWLDEMYKKGALYPYDGVECLYDNTITLKWTWKKWACLIETNFEKYFYISRQDETPVADDPNPDMINRRGIYKDSVGASAAWQDYQLRPNFLVAMVVAPELFNPQHATNALQVVKKHLCGPLGIKTLDPSDWNYRGDYDNSNDSDDPKVAHGFNYHQGPEWLWLTGYFIRAWSKFVKSPDREPHMKLLSNFNANLVDSPWLGLPELTNANGKPCKDSCPIQAWSIGTALEALHEKCC